MKKKHSQVGKQPGKPTFRTPVGFKQLKNQFVKRTKVFRRGGKKKS